MGETARKGSDFDLLLYLSDVELRDFVDQMSNLQAGDVISMPEVRTLIANWAATIRVRMHPAFHENTRAYRKAVATGDFYQGLTPEEAAAVKPDW